MSVCFEASKFLPKDVLRHLSDFTEFAQARSRSAFRPRYRNATVFGVANQKQTRQPISRPKVTPKLIVTDVDGTLLNSSQELTQLTEDAVKAAALVGVPTIVATGKTKGPWSKSVLRRLGPAMPGVYCQGLVVYDADGTIIYSNPLSAQVVAEGILFANKHKCSLVAFSKDRILCDVRDEQTDRVLDFGEAAPEEVGSLLGVLDEVEIHKLIVLASDERIDDIRPDAETFFAECATLTTAVSGMLEILPLGASKGQAVSWLLNYMNVALEDTMALGDGENDIEMLEMVGIGVSMGNATPRAAEAAAFSTASNDQEGWAAAINEHVLKQIGCPESNN